LNDYRGELEQPPLLMVCDHANFRIVTNFNNARQIQWEFNLEQLANGTKIESHPTGFPATTPFELLRKFFEDQNWFHPGLASERVTQDASIEFSKIAESLRSRPNGQAIPPLEAAHFLMKCLFCLFAEDTGILPAKTFQKILGLSRE